MTLAQCKLCFQKPGCQAKPCLGVGLPMQRLVPGVLDSAHHQRTALERTYRTKEGQDSGQHKCGCVVILKILGQVVSARG